ncbi:MAG: phage tail assembly chaperone [Rhodobacteraceae bacterium]|nr:phage tail assembly chaperone [Paracoccaceae bacterium]
MKSFDWPDLMRAGLVLLRLTPEQFWRLTPAELRLMLGQGAAQAPLGRDRLQALLKAFPDGRPGGSEQGEDNE